MRVDDIHPDVALVRQALDSSGAARQRLIERLDPVIRARVRASVGNNGVDVHGLEDLAQQIWVRLFDHNARRLAAFDPALGRSLEGFVGMIAQQEIVELLRRKRLEQAPLDAVPEPAGLDQERRLLSRDFGRRLRAHLDQELPDRGRLVLRFLYDDGRSELEIATIMGVSPQVVANWKHKIRVLARAFRKKHDL